MVASASLHRRDDYVFGLFLCGLFRLFLDLLNQLRCRLPGLAFQILHQEFLGLLRGHLSDLLQLLVLVCDQPVQLVTFGSHRLLAGEKDFVPVLDLPFLFGQDIHFPVQISFSFRKSLLQSSQLGLFDLKFLLEIDLGFIPLIPGL